MKNIKLSLIALVAMGNIIYAGGDITPVVYYETTDLVEAEVAYEQEIVEPIYEEVPLPEPVKPTPKPIKRVPIVIAPTPTPVPHKEPKRISPSGFYAGLGITGTRYESNCNCPTNTSGSSSLGNLSGSTSKSSVTENNLALLARVGYDFNRYIGVEARGIRSIGSGDATISHGGLFVKPMVPVSDGLNIYGLVGFGKTKVTGSLQNVNAESLALGAGVELDLSKDSPKEGRYSREFDGQGDQEKGIGIFVDYERLVVESNAPDLDTLSAGVTYDF